MAITKMQDDELPEKVPERFIVSHIIVKKKTANNSQNYNSSYLQEAADYLILQDAAVKLNANCKDEEKVGSGPGSCSSGSKVDANINSFFAKSVELYNKLAVEDQKISKLVKENSDKFNTLKSGTVEYTKAKEERSQLVDKWQKISAAMYTQIRNSSSESKYTQALSESDWKSGKLAVLTSDKVIMNMTPKEAIELRDFSHDFDYTGFPKILPDTNLDLSSDNITEEIKTYVRNVYSITDADILKSQYDQHKNLKKEYWPTDQQMLDNEYKSRARILNDVKTIDGIVNRSIVPRDITVYGAVRGSFPGDKFQIDGYINASRTYNGMLDMIAKHDISGFPTKMLIKAGTPAIFVEDFQNNLPEDRKTKGSELDPNMREIILPRKLNFNVIRDENGNKILETVPTREPTKDPDIDKLESSLDRNRFSYKEVKVLDPGETRLAMIKSVSSLSDSEKSRLVSYTSKGHIVYNQLSGDAATKFTPEEEKRYSKEADELEQILNKTIMPGKLTVIRGVDEEGWGRLSQLGALDEDSEFQYNGFMSTSYSKSIAKQFAGADKNGNRLYVSVTLPKGTPAALVDKVSAYKGEDEILINRNLTFKSFGVSEEENSGEKILHIEAIPPEQKQNSALLYDAASFISLNRQGKCPRGTVDDSFIRENSSLLSEVASLMKLNYGTSEGAIKAWDTRGRGRKEELEPIKINIQESESFKQNLKKLKSGERIEFSNDKGEDLLLANLSHEVGFDKLPKIESAKNISKLISNGDIELFRGVTNKNFVNEFKHGKYFAGKGTYGNGIYAAVGKRGITTALDYSDKSQNGLIRFVLSKDAKIISDKDLRDSMSKVVNNEKDPEIANLMAIYINDPGKWALMNGYDAISLDWQGYMIILNRNKLVVQKEEILVDQYNTLQELDKKANDLFYKQKEKDSMNKAFPDSELSGSDLAHKRDIITEYDNVISKLNQDIAKIEKELKW